MITITETLYNRMPDDIKACFNQLPNPSSEEVLAIFPNTDPSKKHNRGSALGGNMFNSPEYESTIRGYDDNGGSAARYFYCAKASQRERNEGLEGFEYKNNMRVNAPRNSEEEKTNNKVRNSHPTVKPISLMRYLVRLVTPKNGIVLDPFVGSGTTCIAAIKENFNYIGIEREEEYYKIAVARVEYALSNYMQEIF